MEGSRRTPLLVFLATVLLLCGVSNEQASTCTPGMSKDELGRATVAAAGVFEGRLEVLGGPPASSSSLFVAGEANATFTFRRPHKGKFKQVTRAELRPQVVVRLGLTGDAQVPRTDNVASCSWSDVLVLQENYLVFVGRSSKNSDGQSGVVYFQSTAFPVRSTKDAVKQIRAYRCRKCGRIKTRLTPRSLTVQEGETASVTCRTSGKPVDEIHWFKDRRLLTMTEGIRYVAVRKGSRLVLENVTSQDSGTYQCQAKNAVTTTPLRSTTVTVQPPVDRDNNGIVHTTVADIVRDDERKTLCASQDYCLNHGTCYVLNSLGRKFCRCHADYSGARCQERLVPHQLEIDTDVERINWWTAGSKESLVISAIAICTLLLACCVITAFCIARNRCNRKKHRRIARSDSDYRPPSLPDGHAVNVVNLNAAINRKSAAYSINLAADGSIEPIANYPEQEQAVARFPDHEFPVLRRGPRSGASSVPNSAAARGSGQVRLSMMSNSSSQHGPGYQRLPAISSAADADVHETHQQALVKPRSDCFVDAAEQIELERVAQTEPLDAAVEDTASPRASQCSHTESLICGATSPDDAATGEVVSRIDIQSEASTAPRRCSLLAAEAAGSDAGGSDISEPYDDNYIGDDLEVNFESEADMLAVEMSGDELERNGITTSHDFSELSSQVTTDRGSSDDDYDDGIPDDLFTRQHLLGVFGAGTDGGSSGDLSWDASAEMPSFAVASSDAEVPLQFSKQ